VQAAVHPARQLLEATAPRVRLVIESDAIEILSSTSTEARISRENSQESACKYLQGPRTKCEAATRQKHAPMSSSSNMNGE
jgi:hypothetical protein